MSEGLPFYVPIVRGKPAKVSDPSKHEREEITYPVDLSWGPAFGISEALREFLQNLLDEAAKCNGKNFETLKFDKIGNKTIIHNDYLIFGAILQERNAFYFINYGTIIENPNDLLVIGRSIKGGNSIGRYGEGMKIGIARFLEEKASVKIFACSKYDGRIEYYHFNFTEINGTLKCTRTKLKPDERKMVGSPVHFLVKIKHDIDIDTFDIHNYLWPHGPLYNLNSPGRSGSIGPLKTSNIYVCHLYVLQMDPGKLLYSYDFYNLNISRDRNKINAEELERAIGRIWSREIARNGPAKFITELLPAIGDNWFGFEYHALRYLTEEAEQTVRNALLPALPVWKSDLIEAKTLFNRQFVVVPDGFALTPIKSRVQTESAKVLSAPIGQMSLEQERLIEPIKLNVRECPESPLKFIPSTDGTLIVNKSAITEKDINMFLLLRAIPYCYRNSDELPSLSIQRNPLKLTFVASPPKQTSEEEEEEEVRVEVEEEEEIQARKRDHPDYTPDGYEWVNDWVCIKKNRQ